MLQSRYLLGRWDGCYSLEVNTARACPCGWHLKNNDSNYMASDWVSSPLILVVTVTCTLWCTSVCITVMWNKYIFWVKKLVGLPPNSNYVLAVFSCKSGNNNLSEQFNNICPYTKYEHTQFHSGMGTHIQTDWAYIFLSFNHFSFGVVPNNLGS